MEAKNLKGYHYEYGNKGAVWSNQVHIASHGSETLCGTPMLATNWARIWEHETIGCEECLKIYAERVPTAEQWKEIIGKAEKELDVPHEYPKGFSEYFVDNFTNSLPPIVWGNDYVLSSEPYSHNSEGKGQYIGFYSKQDKAYVVVTTKSNFLKLMTS